MNAWGGAEVLIVGRGGGSIEDLWAFNEEIVVRAIAKSRIPVVSAVGHEVDVTLADLAADVRAATPSHAAELVIPDAREWSARVVDLGRSLDRAILSGLRERRRRVESLTATYGFKRPRDFLARESQRIDDLARRLAFATERRLKEAGRRSRELERSLIPAVRNRLARSRSRLENLSGRLAGLDPTSVLSRGYAMVIRSDGSRVVTAARELHPDDRLLLKFSADQARVTVEAVE
jgi:exodeoxyribonuclease VII large subunit